MYAIRSYYDTIDGPRRQRHRREPVFRVPLPPASPRRRAHRSASRLARITLPELVFSRGKRLPISTDSVVITSYSIHYTKLYDKKSRYYNKLFGSHSLLSINPRISLRQSKFFSQILNKNDVKLIHAHFGPSVITSYSIHYTKLYDG